MNLLPDKFDSLIRLTLSVVSFAEESLPVFEALSYAWGPAEYPAEIILKSPDDQLYLSGGTWPKHCYIFPMKIDPDYILWIDAICVNQQDLGEQSSQVECRGDIHANAYRVVIWLGPEVEDTPLAIESVSLISSKITIDWQIAQLYPKSTEGDWAESNLPPPLNEEQ